MIYREDVYLHPVRSSQLDNHGGLYLLRVVFEPPDVDAMKNQVSIPPVDFETCSLIALHSE
jgi:hypothetical protein